LIKHNEAEKEAKAMQSEIEREQDKQILEAALARERALQEIEE